MKNRVGQQSSSLRRFCKMLNVECKLNRQIQSFYEFLFICLYLSTYSNVWVAVTMYLLDVLDGTHLFVASKKYLLQVKWVGTKELC